MKDLIEYIAKSLVDHPEEVQVRQSGSGSRVRIELSEVEMALRGVPGVRDAVVTSWTDAAGDTQLVGH